MWRLKTLGSNKLIAKPTRASRQTVCSWWRCPRCARSSRTSGWCSRPGGAMAAEAAAAAGETRPGCACKKKSGMVNEKLVCLTNRHKHCLDNWASVTPPYPNQTHKVWLDPSMRLSQLCWRLALLVHLFHSHDYHARPVSKYNLVHINHFIKGCCEFSAHFDWWLRNK